MSSNRAFLGWVAAGYAALLVLHASQFRQADGWYALQILPQMTGAATWIQSAALLYIWLCLIYRYRCKSPQAVDARTLWIACLSVGLLACLTPPANSKDVFSYLQYGRLLAVYHVSPYYGLYDGLSDSYSHYAWLQHQVFLYGPVTLALLYLPGLLTQAGVLAGLYSLKILWLGIHALTVQILWRVDPRQGQRILLYAVSPTILFELIVNAHNDVVGLLFLAAALLCLMRRQPLAAFAMALLAALTKPQGYLWLGGLLILSAWQRQWRVLGQSVLLLAGTILLLRLMVFHAFSDLLLLWPPSTGTFGVVGNNWPGMLAVSASEVNAPWLSLVRTVWPVAKGLALAWVAAAVLSARTLDRLLWGQFLATTLLLGVISDFSQPWYCAWFVLPALFLSREAFRYALLSMLTGPLSVYVYDLPLIDALIGVVAGWCLATVFDPEAGRVEKVVSTLWVALAVVFLVTLQANYESFVVRTLFGQGVPLSLLVGGLMRRRRE